MDGLKREKIDAVLMKKKSCCTFGRYSSAPNRRPVLNRRPGGKFTQI